MHQLIARQIALLTLVSSCLLIVLLVLASGLSVDVTEIHTQIIPLAIVCAAALTVIVLNPWEERSRR